jgi:hypothetical protein
MRVIRSAGQNVSPADDGRLYSKAFADGLFEDVAITSLGTNLVSIGALYGIICGRDFTAEAQNITVVLPETETSAEGVIYVEIDISSDDVITIGSSLKPFTPTYEDINLNGAVAQMIIAEYTASPVAVTDITSVYPVATAGGIGSMATIEISPVKTGHSVGEYIVWKGQLYKVTSAIVSGETLVVGTNIAKVTVGNELQTLNNGLRDYVIITQRTSAEITINANDRGVFTVDVSKSGYTPIGIVGIALSNNWMYVGGYSVTGNIAQVIIHNGVNRVQSNQTVYLTVLYKLTNV